MDINELNKQIEEIEEEYYKAMDVANEIHDKIDKLQLDYMLNSDKLGIVLNKKILFNNTYFIRGNLNCYDTKKSIKFEILCDENFIDFEVLELEVLEIYCSISDDKDAMFEKVKKELQKNKLKIITGGLY